jgi:hypothetical protein
LAGIGILQAGQPLLPMRDIVNESVHSQLGRTEAGWRCSLDCTTAAGRIVAQRCRLALPDPSAAAAVRTHMLVVVAAIACIFLSSSEMYHQRSHGLLLDHRHLCSGCIPLHRRGRLVGSTCLGGG